MLFFSVAKYSFTGFSKLIFHFIQYFLNYQALVNGVSEMLFFANPAASLYIWRS